MLKQSTAVFRFRDHRADIDTVAEHLKIIRRAQYTWWGWWRKQSEPDRARELEELQDRARRQPISIGLFDRSTDRYFSAQAGDFVRDPEHKGAPEPARVPSYYPTGAKVEAWIKVLGIEPIFKNIFTELFGNVPIGEHTFFLSGGENDGLPSRREYTRLSSNYVVHVSDLHFGSDHGFPKSKAIGRDTVIGRLKEDLQHVSGGQVGLVIVSGDLTTKGDGNTLIIEGQNFLTDLHQELSVPKEAILVIPGNHDFRLMEYQPTDFSHERPFHLMLRDFYGNYQPDEKIRRFEFPSGHRVEFLLINSVRLRKMEESNYGYIEWPLYEGYLRANEKDPDATRVAILHHHLVSIPREEPLSGDYPHASISTTIDSGAVIEGLQAHDFRLVLHGHQHLPAIAQVSRGVLDYHQTVTPPVDLVISAAGSAGAKVERLSDAMRDNSYSLLNFGRTDIQIEARRYNAGMSATRLFVARG